MKCRDVEFWLYSCRSKASWPAELVGHLQQCGKCRRLQAQLKQVDEEVHKLTSATSMGEESGKRKLLALIETTPQDAVPVESAAAPRKAWLRRGWFLTGAAALIVFGWLLGRGGESDNPIQTVEVYRDKPVPVEVVRERIQTVEVFRDKIVSVNSPAERNLFATLMRRNALLVQAADAVDRLTTLLDMADDCQRHVRILLDQGPREHLPLAINLYAKLLRDGVLPQLERVPEANRPAQAIAVRSRLERMNELPRNPANPLPKVVMDQQDALQAATRRAIDQIDRPEGAPAPVKIAKLHSSEPIHPATALVLFAIAVGSEADPVGRAEVCAECIQQLMPCVLINLADESENKQSELGQQFGELIRFGIYAPLAQAAEKDPSPQMKDKANEILQATTQAVEVMEKNLQKAPVGERIGLERAIEATKKGWEKSKGKGKSKEKDKGKGKDFPGPLKKISLDGKGVADPVHPPLVIANVAVARFLPSPSRRTRWLTLSDGGRIS